MIERIHGLAKGVIGMRAVGTFTVADYVDTIEPELEKLEAAHQRAAAAVAARPRVRGLR